MRLSRHTREMGTELRTEAPKPHSTPGNQSPQMYTEAAGMTLEPLFLRDFYAAERLSPLRSSPSPSSGSRSYAPNSLK